jgi:tRNA A-37 threonylcarbamoyl transferase component Bud32
MDDALPTPHPSSQPPISADGFPIMSAMTPTESGTVPAKTIAGYRMVREIARGGQGVVYEAVRESIRRRVAIKVLIGGSFVGRREATRFDREAQILAGLDHPNIVGIIDRGTADDGTPFLVMDYIDGQPLDAYLASTFRKPGNPPPDVKLILLLFLKIADAVNAAHLRGIVHRDLKPSNIRIDAAGEPHILDFGLARTGTHSGNEGTTISVTGHFMGSLPWASPEQAEGALSKIDTRTDVYALGVILYQMLTGQFPYPVVGPMRVVIDNISKAQPLPPSKAVASSTGPSRRGHWRAITRRPGVDAALDAITLKALAKAMDQRYQTAGDMARDLARYLGGRAILAEYRPNAALRWLGTGAAVAAVVLLGVLAWEQWPRRSAPAGRATPLEVATPLPTDDPTPQPLQTVNDGNLSGATAEQLATLDPYQGDAASALLAARWRDKVAQNATGSQRTEEQEKALLFYERYLALRQEDDAQRQHARLAAGALEKQLGWVNLLDMADVVRDVRDGPAWERTPVGIIPPLAPPKSPPLVFPAVVSGDMEIVVRYVRTTKQGFHISMPLGEKCVEFSFGFWDRSGFEFIKGHSAHEEQNARLNEGMVRHSFLLGRRGESVLVIRCEMDDRQNVHLSAHLNGKLFVEWRGQYADVNGLDWHEQGSVRRLGPEICSKHIVLMSSMDGPGTKDCGGIFHSVRVRMLTGTLQPTRMPVIGPASDGTILLTAPDAEIIGKTLRIEFFNANDHPIMTDLTAWRDPADYPQWQAQITHAGTYIPTIRYIMPGGTDAKVSLRAGDQETSADLAATRGTDFQSVDFPPLKIAKAGVVVLAAKMRPTSGPVSMTVQNVVLKPAAPHGLPPMATGGRPSGPWEGGRYRAIACSVSSSGKNL